MCEILIRAKRDARVLKFLNFILIPFQLEVKNKGVQNTTLATKPDMGESIKHSPQSNNGATQRGLQSMCAYGSSLE